MSKITRHERMDALSKIEVLLTVLECEIEWCNAVDLDEDAVKLQRHIVSKVKELYEHIEINI